MKNFSDTALLVTSGARRPTWVLAPDIVRSMSDDVNVHDGCARRVLIGASELDPVPTTAKLMMDLLITMHSRMSRVSHLHTMIPDAKEG